MYKNNVYTFKNLPVEERQRKCTDVCCTIITAIFALTLFILSFSLFTRSNYYKVNFPVDRTNTLCYQEQTDAPYMYFANINDLTANKYCVNKCPKAGNGLICSNQYPCPGVISSYSTSPEMTTLGAFCLPDDQNLNNLFWSSQIIQNKDGLIKGYTIIFLTGLIGLCIGILYVILFIFMPKAMAYMTFILAFVSLLIAAIFFIVGNLNIFNGFWRIFLGIVFIIISLLLLIFFFCYQRQIEIASIFLHSSVNFLKQTPIVFAYIPLFLIFSFGLIVLCIWQYIAFGTTNQPTLNPGDLYYISKQNIFLQVLNAIEFVWGIQFLRDAFNYIISGNTVEWYFTANRSISSECCRPLSRLLLRNWGSVVGGAFLNAFFSIFTIIFDIFRCDPKGKCGKMFNCCSSYCCCFSWLFEFVRADPYAYIHLSGIAYCNSARQCEALCLYSNLFASDHSCVRLIRVSTQIFLTCLTVLIGYLILDARTDYSNAIILAIIVCFAYIATTFFADIACNGAEGLLICYLAQQNCEGYNFQCCPEQLRSEVYQFEQKYNILPQ